MKKLLLSSLLGVVLVVGGVLTTGCGAASFLITNLAAIEATAEAISAIALPAPLSSVVNGYLVEVSTATSETAKELTSTDSTAVKALDIAGFWANVVVPQIPGAPAKLTLEIQAIDNLIKTLLGEILPVKAAVLAGHTASVPAIKFGFSDRSKLFEIEHKADALVKKVAK